MGATTDWYDGFLSYAHSTDALTAQKLRAALQRFAKPWWKRRAVRMFLDESSLAANPHLWTSISGALDTSEWLVVLLSPEAARSKWVGKEIEHWVANKARDRILPVVTDGQFGWDPALRSVVGVSVPPALRGVFPEEPRWVDLRAARADGSLDVKNPVFHAAVADVASALRDIPKDELASEEVRQHRKTVRTAAVAGLALLVLAVAATGFALQSASNARLAEASVVEAQAFAAQAQASAEAETAAREEADQNAQLAEEEAARANEAASQMLQFVRQLHAVSLGASGAIAADSVAERFPTVAEVPDTPRLDFLYDKCSDPRPGAPGCYRDAAFVDREETVATTRWQAHIPFHIREGFVNTSDEPLALSANSHHRVHVFVTRVAGPELDDGAFPIGERFMYRSDYLLRTTSDRCGPGYRTQELELQCDQFVHEFPVGLPPGRYSFWVEWHAPCAAWVVREMCETDFEIVSLFASSVDIAFYHDSFTPDDDPGGRGNPDWPFDPWEYAEPFDPRDA